MGNNPDKVPDIVLKNVSFSYSGTPVLDHVNLKIMPGDFASLVGPNGGGKTTLLKLILGLLKPSSGEISVFGKSPQKSKLRLGYMPQYISLDMQFPATVFDVVLMGRLGNSFTGRYSKQDKKTAITCLKEVRLENMKNSLLGDLSGGQRQRVLIARSLCCEPDLLLLDEPTANIDREIEETFFEILSDLNKRMTVLLVSHDIGFVSQVVKSVICVSGKVVVHPTSEIQGKMINELYGNDLRMIRHDHVCSEKGHFHD